MGGEGARVWQLSCVPCFWLMLHDTLGRHCDGTGWWVSLACTELLRTLVLRSGARQGAHSGMRHVKNGV